MSAGDDIRTALGKLDVKNDDHWTSDGLPRIDALGLPSGITRAAVTTAAPQFTRTNPSLDEKPKASETPPADGPVAPEPVVAGTRPVVTNPVAAMPTSEEVAQIEARVAELREVVQSHQAALDAQKSEYDKASRELDRLLELRDRLTDRRNENMLGIRAVLERGKVERAEKAKVAQELRSIGVTAKLLQSKSPIDQAMARKTGHGLNRPNFTAR